MIVYCKMEWIDGRCGRTGIRKVKHEIPDRIIFDYPEIAAALIVHKAHNINNEIDIDIIIEELIKAIKSGRDMDINTIDEDIDYYNDEVEIKDKGKNFKGNILTEDFCAGFGLTQESTRAMFDDVTGDDYNSKNEW